MQYTEEIRLAMRFKKQLEKEIDEPRKLIWRWDPKYSLHGLCPKKWDNYLTAISPSAYVAALLPFAPLDWSRDDAFVDHIEPDLVCGGRYHPSDTYETYSDQDVFEAFDMAANTFKEDRHCIPIPLHAARYIKVGVFPLWVAIEGKNRVELYEKYKKPIPAIVTRATYPDPKDLIIVRARGPWNVHYLICTDNCFVGYGPSSRVLAYPNVSLPLLEAYGVKKEIGTFDVLAIREILAARRKVTCSQMLS
jgi:hypothetical protein